MTNQDVIDNQNKTEESTNNEDLSDTLERSTETIDSITKDGKKKVKTNQQPNGNNSASKPKSYPCTQCGKVISTYF